MFFMLFRLLSYSQLTYSFRCIMILGGVVFILMIQDNFCEKITFAINIYFTYVSERLSPILLWF